MFEADQDIDQDRQYPSVPVHFCAPFVPSARPGDVVVSLMGNEAFIVSDCDLLAARLVHRETCSGALEIGLDKSLEKTLWAHNGGSRFRINERSAGAPEALIPSVDR